MGPLSVSTKKVLTVLTPLQCVYKISKPFLIIASEVYMFPQLCPVFIYYFYDGKRAGEELFRLPLGENV